MKNSNRLETPDVPRKILTTMSFFLQTIFGQPLNKKVQVLGQKVVSHLDTCYASHLTANEVRQILICQKQ